MWTDLPEYVFEEVVEHVQEDRKVSASFRRVCHAWREAHDRLVTVLEPNGASQDARLWSKFGGVKTLHFTPSSMPPSDVVNDNALMKVLEQFTDLTSLDLTGRSSATNEQVKTLAEFTALTSLNLGGCDEVTAEGLSALASLTALTSLNLAECYKASGEGIRALSPLTALTSLELTRCESVSNEGISSLALLTAMTNLTLKGCNRVGDEGVRALSPLTALASLCLAHCLVTDEGVRAMAPLIALTDLDLCGCRGLTDEGLRAMAQLTTLTSLNLACCPGLSDEGIKSTGLAHRAHQPRLFLQQWGDEGGNKKGTGPAHSPHVRSSWILRFGFRIENIFGKVPRIGKVPLLIPACLIVSLKHEWTSWTWRAAILRAWSCQ
jgi:hypothetical protein